MDISKAPETSQTSMARHQGSKDIRGEVLLKSAEGEQER